MRTHIGQYQIETPLGRGGMGVVYRGVHAHLGRPVAIKELAPELTQQPEFKERFFSEAKTQARLQHPNIVGVYDLLEDSGDFFIVMELVVGEPLDDILRARNRQGMDLGETTAIFGQILAALDYAHSEGVIHRDVKPSNVIVTPGGRVKLTDFGIALLVGDKRLTASQSAIGTPAYMSPEQILHPRSIDHRTDIYSAAVVFFEMIAGVPPFDSDSEYMIKKLHVETPPDLAKLGPLVPAPVIAALATALAKDPEARFPNAGLFQRALHEAVSSAVASSGAPVAAAPLPAAGYRPTVPDVPATGGFRPSVPSFAAAAPSTGGGPAPVPIAPSSPAGRSGLGLAILTAAAVIILGLGLVYFLFNRNHGDAVPPAAQTPTPPAAASIQQAALTATPSAPLAVPAESVQPMAAPLEPAAAATPAPPPPPSASPVERPRSEKPVPRVQEKRTESPPAPPPSVETSKPVEEPAQAAAEPAAPVAAGSAGSGTALGQLQDMEDVVMSVERFAKQANEAYADSDSGGEVGDLLEKFAESAEKVRKEFRAASGTGIGGLKSKLLRFGKGGQQADTKVLEGKAKELIRQGEVIDRAIKSDPLPPAAQQFWADTRSQLRRLGRFFP